MAGGLCAEHGRRHRVLHDFLILLVWVYYSAQIFLLGAEFTWVHAHRFGSRRGRDQPPPARDTLATDEGPSRPIAR